MEIVLRGYMREDLDALVALDDLCFAEPFRFSRKSMRRFAESAKARVVVAEVAQMVVGFCVLHVEDAGEVCAGYVVTLDVAPHRRRTGLATQMMQAMEVQAVEAGCSLMALHVFAGNAAAIAFYERCGFEFLHTVREFYGVGLDAGVYRKAIGRSEAS